MLYKTFTFVYLHTDCINYFATNVSVTFHLITFLPASLIRLPSTCFTHYLTPFGSILSSTPRSVCSAGQCTFTYAGPCVLPLHQAAAWTVSKGIIKLIYFKTWVFVNNLHQCLGLFHGISVLCKPPSISITSECLCCRYAQDLMTCDMLYSSKMQWR